MNPSDDWIIEEVPDLRPSRQDLWDTVKARQFETRSAAISNGISKLGCTKPAKHLFSGIIK